MIAWLASGRGVTVVYWFKIHERVYMTDQKMHSDEPLAALAKTKDYRNAENQTRSHIQAASVVCTT